MIYKVCTTRLIFSSKLARRITSAISHCCPVFKFKELLLTIPTFGYFVSIIDYGSIIPHDAVLSEKDSDYLTYDMDALNRVNPKFDK